MSQSATLSFHYRRSPDLRGALGHCREVTRQHSQTFYLGSCLFPAGQREAVWAVYAACRHGDDIADQVVAGQSQPGQLAAWWTDIEAAFQGRPTHRPHSRALAWAAETYQVPLAPFAELYEGLQMDLRGHTYVTMDDLLLYCRRVAGVVGFMIAPISGYQGGERTLEQALWLGQAMQLTNILRDVGEDLGRGRVYLPAELLAQYGLDGDDLRRGAAQGILPPGYRDLMAHLSGTAHGWYALGRPGIPQLRGSARWAVATAALAYEGILDDLAAAGYDNFSRRAHVSMPRKLLTVPRAWWSLRAQA